MLVEGSFDDIHTAHAARFESRLARASGRNLLADALPDARKAGGHFGMRSPGMIVA